MPTGEAMEIATSQLAGGLETARAVVGAATVYGCLRALATLTQLVSYDAFGGAYWLDAPTTTCVEVHLIE